MRAILIIIMGMAVLATACGKEEITDESFIPNGFIEEKIQKNEFDSYEEVISYLEAGQAYTYVDVLGSDEPVLLVTEGTYDNQDGKNDSVSISAYVYVQNENGVSCSSMIASNGTAHYIGFIRSNQKQVLLQKI